MGKKKSKAEAIKLLQQNIDAKTVAERTGYGIRRIYDFKKELESTEQPPETPTDPAPLQLQTPTATSPQVEEKLEKALDTLLEHLEREVTTDTIEGIIKITEALDKLRSPTYNIAELIKDEEPTNEKRTGIRSENDEREDPPTASADGENFVDILERTSKSTEADD